MYLRSSSASRRKAILCGLAALFLCAGCTVGPNYKRPTAAVPANWEVTKPWREAEPKDAVPKTTWWTVFHDDDLNGMEIELLAANQTLKVALANFEQARASAAVQNATLFPTFSVDPQAGRERYSGTRPTGSSFPLTGPVTQANYYLPFTVSYEVDLFGRRRRTIEAAQASYQANAADLENVRLVLTAELAADYFTLRRTGYGDRDTESHGANAAERAGPGEFAPRRRHRVRARRGAGRNASEHYAHAGHAAATAAQTI